MSRKEPTFAQLYDYITREGDHDTRFTYTQNFILKSREEILREFERNSALLSKRKNGNYLYHEVISITRAKKLSEDRQKELLQDIVSQYCQSRGKDCLVFGGLHDEKDNNLHFHLVISANKYNQSRRYSLKKASFDKIKKQTELYVLERYPELEQEKLISKELTVSRTSNKEQELKRRTGKPSQKDLFKARLTEIFANSVDKQNFFDNLREAGIEIYTRGKTIGFVDLENNRKHRLKTLGLESEFEAINQTISKTEKQKAEANKPADPPEQESEELRPEAKPEKSKKQTKPEQKPDAKVRNRKEEIIESRKASMRRKRDQSDSAEHRDAQSHKDRKKP